MNNKTRTQLRKISNQLDVILSTIEDYKSQLETIQEEEQEKYDNMPEQLQETENGCRMYECIENLEEIVSRLDDIMTEIEGLSCDVMNVTEI